MKARSIDDESALSASRRSTAVADSIRSVAASVPDNIHEDPRKIVAAILLLIDEICIEGEYEEQFDEWRDKVAESWCALSGEHQWIHDHCGFWGHQYCSWCRTPKYPEIPGSCSKCGDLMKLTESEYLSRQNACDNRSDGPKERTMSDYENDGSLNFMPHLCHSQSEFEVARDIVTLMKAMKRGEKLSVEIECTDGHFDWRCSGDNQPCGPSEAAKAMREGYDRVFMRGKRCECHERDSSYVCDYCYAQGERGHMQT